MQNIRISYAWEPDLANLVIGVEHDCLREEPTGMWSSPWELLNAAGFYPDHLVMMKTHNNMSVYIVHNPGIEEGRMPWGMVTARYEHE